MGSLFGTDGIRGRANTFPMTPEVALQVGRAVARLLRAERILVGRDTRLSGDMIAHSLAAGVCSAGADAILAGVLPTPGIAVATRLRGADAGIVVSASHNPYEDNGIKIFGPDGYKLPDETEAAVEAAVTTGDAAAANSNRIGRIRSDPEAESAYADFLRTCSAPTHGLSVVLDCANGATCRVAPRVFAESGSAVNALNISPDGRNINLNCGSQHPQGLSRAVVRAKADVGLAFDGDGDRLIAVDETGEVISGDRILAICARHLQNSGRLRNATVVSTVMSNVGLGQTLRKLGIRHIMTQVGDRHVVQAMRQEGAVLGGEDSGHLVVAERHTTGDGILSGLLLLEAMRVSSQPLSRLKEIMIPFPQVLLNVPVKSKPRLEELPAVSTAVRAAEQELGESGRVLVRYSGTEPLCRVMVEGPAREDVERICRRLADTIGAAIG